MFNILHDHFALLLLFLDEWQVAGPHQTQCQVIVWLDRAG